MSDSRPKVLVSDAKKRDGKITSVRAGYDNAQTNEPPVKDRADHDVRSESKSQHSFTQPLPHDVIISPKHEPSQSSQPISIVVPTSVNIDASQYITYDESATEPSRTVSTYKNKREEIKDSQETDGEREARATNPALLRMQELMLNIFEAEDHAEPDTSGALPKESQQFFLPTTIADSQQCVLQTNILNQLDVALSKLVTSGAFEDLSVDYLARIEKLCARSLTLLNSDDIILFSKTDVAECDRWEEQADAADNSLRATKILLRIMTAAEDEKQLQSDEVLQDLLANLRTIMDKFVIPLVETQASSLDDGAMRITGSTKMMAVGLMKRAGSAVKVLGEFASIVDLSEQSVTTIEFLATKLIFLENAPSEKESLLGIQRFETLRRYAMDLLSRVYLKRPEQRSFIIDEILSSLEKLPTTRQSARQFKVAEGKPIQLVSALVMQLVQTTSISTADEPTQTTRNTDEPDAFDDEEDEDDSDSERPANFASLTPRRKSMKDRRSMESVTNVTVELEAKAKILFDGAQNSAAYLTKYLIQRALSSTKTGDQPYRNLLDIFTEDFLSVLGSPEWPAAELLLRSILSNLIGIMENDKSPAPAKNMALDLMGIMGSEIAELRKRLQRGDNKEEDEATPVMQKLYAMCEESLNDELNDKDFLSLQGPWPILLNFLQDAGGGLQMLSSQSYNTALWARNICNIYTPRTEDDEEEDPSKELMDFRRLATHLLSLMSNAQFVRTSRYDAALVWSFLLTLYSMRGPALTAEGRLAHCIVLLNLPFCRAFRKVFGILLTSLTSPQATVRSRSLKSVIQFLEKDSSLLDRGTNALAHITRCSSDASAMVRDSALGLIGKCMALKPSFEPQLTRLVIARTDDAAVGVRKRALKLLKDVYLRNQSQDLKAAIADSILRRTLDLDDGVNDLTQQTMEEIWIIPFSAAEYQNPDLSASHRQRLYNHVALIVRTAQSNESVSVVLEAFLEKALATGDKNHESNKQACKGFVQVMFDLVVDAAAMAGIELSQLAIIETLTIMARACPQLFTGDQMTLLKPYIDNLKTTEDLLMYRSVIAIYRCVLPTLPPLSASFLKAVQDNLFNSVAKLGKLELHEVAACLWIIDGVLKNTERLVRLVASVLQGITATKKVDLNLAEHNPLLLRLKRYVMIAGHLGQACDLEDHADTFREKMPSWKDKSVAGLIVDVVLPYCRSDQPLSLREMAVESVCLVCQAWPKNFLKPGVSSVFEAVFKNHENSLEFIVLTGIRAFYAAEEERSRSGAAIPVGDGASTGAERLGKSMALSDNDGATTSIAQQFLPYILAIATASYDELALLATEVIVSTNRQGLVHPKETGVTLVVLETSTNQAIANAAFEEHRGLHQKHESMLEKEYLKAIELVFAYQRDVIHDILGTEKRKHDNAVPKLRLFWEVLKTGSFGLRKKLLGNLCLKLDVSPTRLAEPKDLLLHLQYVRFILENLALLEYSRIDELLQICNNVEKIFTNTGNSLTQRIAAELSIQFHGIADVADNDPAESAPGLAVDDRKLQQLSMVAIIMTMLWETRNYLRRSWTLYAYMSTKTKTSAKDTAKPPTKSTSAYPEKYLDAMQEFMGSLANTESMMARCRAFVDLAAVDADFKAESDGEDDSVVERQRFQTPSDVSGERGDSYPPSGGSRGRKRRASASAAGTPRKVKKRARPSLKRKSTGSVVGTEDEDALGDWE